MTKAVLLLLCCLVAGAWAASANPKKLTREQEKAFLAALGMSGIRGKIRARRDASLRDHTSSKGENIGCNSFAEDNFGQYIFIFEGVIFNTRQNAKLSNIGKFKLSANL